MHTPPRHKHSQSISDSNQTLKYTSLNSDVRIPSLLSESNWILFDLSDKQPGREDAVLQQSQPCSRNTL